MILVIQHARPVVVQKQIMYVVGTAIAQQHLAIALRHVAQILPTFTTQKSAPAVKKVAFLNLALHSAGKALLDQKRPT